MEKVLSFLVCCVALAPLTSAHIHSHKVKHYEEDRVNLHTWIYSLLSSAAVGACGVFPLIVNRWVRLDSSCKDKAAFRTLLSFAVGGLLGDVFLHLLPEAWGSQDKQVGISLGLWVTVGLLSFMLVEKVVKLTEEATSGDGKECQPGTALAVQGSQTKDCVVNGSSKILPHVNGCVKNAGLLVKNELKRTNGYTGTNGYCRPNAESIGATHVNVNGVTMKSSSHVQAGGPPVQSLYNQCSSGDETNGVERNSQHATLSPRTMQTESCSRSRSRWLEKDISGYLNLVANCTDNFTHGLAIATSYVASPAVGLLTTLAILCHEIPHEIGDFAILLNSGFNLKEAAKAQMTTACGGLVGVVAGLTAEHLSDASVWLLPFTAGGFLYIALISIIPDLLEDSSKISLKQTVMEIVAVVMGIVIMAMVTIVEKKSCGHMPLHLKH